MPNVIMLNVIMLSVATPSLHLQAIHFFEKEEEIEKKFCF
jgi:hypothetical protein